MLISLILCVIIVTSSSCIGNNENLIGVIQIFRHGERTPLLHYPNDPYAKESYWGAPPMELTNTGKRECYKLGQFTRQRYDDFLPRKYSRTKFLIYTTDFDRTHMSAQVFVAGLFPPIKEEIWKNDINWQPIPIRPIDRSILHDNLINSCPSYGKELVEVIMKSSLKMKSENGSLIDYIVKHAGYNEIDLFHLYFMYDNLNLQHLFDFQVPKWTEQIFPEPLRSFVLMYFDTLGFSKHMRKLAIGPFLNEIIHRFKELLVNTKAPKFITFAGHETNIVILLKTLGYQNEFVFPEFACSVFIELRKGISKPYLNIHFKNGNNMYPVIVPGCGFDCNLDDFERILTDYITDSNIVESDCKSVNFTFP